MTQIAVRDPANAAAPDFADRQQVEGYAVTVSQPGIAASAALVGRGVGNDHRGETSTAAARDWWRPRPADEPDLVWLTASVPEAVDTTFVFAAQSGDLPENMFPPNQASVFADDAYALTFDLGQRERRVWRHGEWALEYLPRQVHTPAEGYHRQFQVGGCAGVYRLAAPAAALERGQPLRLKVVLEPPRCEAPAWFAVSERPDVLEVSPRTNAEQIEQLQREVIHLKQIAGNLARRSYPELFPERLATEEVIIYAGGRAHTHPPDVALLHNGDLLATFREASEHLSADGRIVTVRSTDGGRTWGDRRVVRETPGTDERDPSIAQLRDGSLIMNVWINGYYAPNGRYLGRPEGARSGRPAGMYIARSTDAGRTWDWLSEAPLDPAPFPQIYTSERLLELPSGDLLMAAYFSVRTERTRRRGCALYVSGDGGRTWQCRATMADLPDAPLGEPALARTRTGRLITVMRNEGGAEYYHAVSDDDGRTWSPALPSGIPGRANPASLLPLPDGRVLCVYGSRHGAKGIYVVASHDDGLTWDIPHRRVIRDDFPNWDCGYPSTLLLPDGRVLAAYYFNMFGRYCIAGSVFRWP